MLLLVRMYSVNPASKVGVAVQEVRPRHKDGRELLATADIQKPGFQTRLLDTVALIVRVVLRRVEGVLQRGEPVRLELLADHFLRDVLEGEGSVKCPIVRLDFNQCDQIGLLFKNRGGKCYYKSSLKFGYVCGHVEK